MIACHKDANFQEAKQFCPERWIDASSGNFTVNVDSASIVVPFGVGRRTCPGKRFVEMEVVLLLAKVSSRMSFTYICISYSHHSSYSSLCWPSMWASWSRWKRNSNSFWHPKRRWAWGCAIASYETYWSEAFMLRVNPEGRSWYGACKLELKSFQKTFLKTKNLTMDRLQSCPYSANCGMRYISLSFCQAFAFNISAAKYALIFSPICERLSYMKQVSNRKIYI